MNNPQIIIEIVGDELYACDMLGDEITPSHPVWDDLADCCTSGDCEDACQFVIDQVGVEFRCIGRNANNGVENRLAIDADLQQVCEAIYFESDTDFSDRDNAELYAVWQAANNIIEDHNQENES